MTERINRRIIKPEQEQEVIRLYCEDLLSTPVIAKMFNCKHNAINKVLERNGVSRRTRMYCMTKNKINKNYFKKIDTEEKAYFLGLLFADGCNFRRGVSLSLQERDGYLVEAFRNALCSETLKLILQPKEKANHQNQIRCSIGSWEISQDLSALGCVPAKSLILKFPTEQQVPVTLMNHFIRGYFDGDGCIFVCESKKIGSISFCGSKMFCAVLKEIIEKIGVNLSYDNRDNIAVISAGGTNNLFKMYKYLYNEATIYMRRKKEKFEHLFLIRKVNMGHGNKTKEGFTSNYRGVLIRPAKNGRKTRIECHFKHQKKCIYLGAYATEEEAAIAYDKKNVELGRPIFYLNFPERYDEYRDKVYLKLAEMKD